MNRGAGLRLLVLGAIWGTSFLFIKVGLEGLPPLGVALGRTVAGMVTLWVLLLLRRKRVGEVRPLREARVQAHLVVVALVVNAIPFFLFSWGEQHVSSGIAGIYNATTPLWTLLFALLVLPSERPTRARIAGLVLGSVGVVTVLGPWRGVGSNSVLGQLACLTAGAAYGVGFNYIRRNLTPRRIDPVALSACQLTWAALLLAATLPWIHDVHLTWRVVGAVGALGALGTGIAFVMYHGLIRDLGATSASQVTFVIPVFAVALGVIVLGERLTWNLFAGAIVVGLGVAVAEGRLRPRRAVP